MRRLATILQYDHPQLKPPKATLLSLSYKSYFTAPVVLHLVSWAIALGCKFFFAITEPRLTRTFCAHMSSRSMAQQAHMSRALINMSFLSLSNRVRSKDKGEHQKSPEASNCEWSNPLEHSQRFIHCDRSAVRSIVSLTWKRRFALVSWQSLMISVFLCITRTLSRPLSPLSTFNTYETSSAR